MSVGDAPEIFCPADFAADNDEGVCGAVVNFAPPVLSPDSKSVRYIPIVGRTIYDWQDAFKED